MSLFLSFIEYLLHVTILTSDLVCDYAETYRLLRCFILFLYVA